MAETVLEQKYLDFIDEILSQVEELLPEDVNELQKNYLMTNIKKSAILMAESEQENEEFRVLDFDEQCFYIQLIAEWSFHKEIDLFRSGIPPKYWKVVMQKIWYTMWEVMYACLKNNASRTVILTLVERFVDRTYSDAVDELRSQNLIDEVVEEQAKEQSNINKMAQEIRIAQEFKDKITDTMKKVMLAIAIAIGVTFLIHKFNNTGIIIVLTLLVLYNVMPTKTNNY